MGYFVDTASSYVNLIVDMLTVTLGEAAPGAAPTPRKRSPWRPPWMGRQGKLPTWTASRRRVLPGYRFPYTDALNKVYKVLSNANSVITHVG